MKGAGFLENFQSAICAARFGKLAGHRSIQSKTKPPQEAAPLVRPPVVFDPYSDYPAGSEKPKFHLGLHKGA